MALRVSPGLFRRAMNLWPPFRGAGIRVSRIADDWSHVRVELRAKLLNRNFVGTHFGGSLFAMTDPFHMLMLLHQLGDDYVVWDQASEIEFLQPGRGTVSAEIKIGPAELAALRAEASGGDRVLRDFEAEIRNAQNELVARVRKRVYVRLKKRLRAAPAAADGGTSRGP
jgi:acyl-coenzyme A thioesterase PaaI-like protein